MTPKVALLAPDQPRRTVTVWVDGRPAPAAPKPRLRGVLHEIALFVSVPLGVALGLLAAGTRAQVSAAIFAGAVFAMFGATRSITASPGRPRRVCGYAGWTMPASSA